MSTGIKEKTPQVASRQIQREFEGVRDHLVDLRDDLELLEARVENKGK
jgi:hypothetical protein